MPPKNKTPRTPRVLTGLSVKGIKEFDNDIPLAATPLNKENFLMSTQKVYGFSSTKKQSPKKRTPPKQTEEIVESPQKVVSDEDEELLLGYEHYFEGRGGKKTSNNTMAMLETLEQKDFDKALATVHDVKDKKLLLEKYRNLYDQWLLEMSYYFNVCLYGLGSKKKVLEEFQNKKLQEEAVFVIYGYFPTISIREILGQLHQQVLEHKGSLGSVQEQAQRIVDYHEQKPQELYIIVHNIDGPNLRTEIAQNVFATLAASSYIHLIASVDHINVGLLWNQDICAKFSWVWHDISTFEPYAAETRFENTLMMQRQELGIRGTKFVLTSLTPNARGIFRILAQHQLKQPKSDNRHESGLPYHDFYDSCKAKFLVSNDMTFRTQLVEFQDHKIIQSKRTSDGTEFLYIPLPIESIAQILETLEK